MAYCIYFIIKLEEGNLTPCFNLINSSLEEKGATKFYHKKNLSYFHLDTPGKEPIQQGIEAAESGRD